METYGGTTQISACQLPEGNQYAKPRYKLDVCDRIVSIRRTASLSQPMIGKSVNE
jgi:hypothetical protein